MLNDYKIVLGQLDERVCVNSCVKVFMYMNIGMHTSMECRGNHFITVSKMFILGTKSNTCITNSSMMFNLRFGVASYFMHISIVMTS